MLTAKHVFRPAWLRTVGPGLVLAMLLATAIVLATHLGMISPDLALRLHLVPNVVLLGFCTRWWLKGSIVVTSNQVVLQGWTWRIDARGRKRPVYTRESVPRSEWDSITVKGLVFATVTWRNEDETIVFERMGRPDLLRKLLAAPAAPLDSLLSLKPLPLLLIALAKTLKLAISGISAQIARLYPQAGPHVNAAAAWALRQARRTICPLGVHMVALSGGSRSLALEYTRFVAFCRHYLLDRQWSVVQEDLAEFYWRILRDACVVYGPAPSAWMLHPRVQSVDDIMHRIPQRAFEQRWFEKLLQDIDADRGDRDTLGQGGFIARGEPTRIPVALHQAG